MSTSANRLPFCLLTKVESLLTGTKMCLLRFILLILLGLLAPSAASAPGEMADVATENDGQDLDRTAGNHLAARQGYPSELLLTYKLKCALDPKTEKAPNYKGTQGRKGTKFLKDSFCRRYYKCESDGKELWDAIYVH